MNKKNVKFLESERAIENKQKIHPLFSAYIHTFAAHFWPFLVSYFFSYFSSMVVEYHYVSGIYAQLYRY